MNDYRKTHLYNAARKWKPRRIIPYYTYTITISRIFVLLSTNYLTRTHARNDLFHMRAADIVIMSRCSSRKKFVNCKIRFRQTSVTARIACNFGETECPARKKGERERERKNVSHENIGIIFARLNSAKLYRR